MGGKNAYIEQRRKERQEFFDVGEEMGIQKAWDYVQIVLTNPDVMGDKTLTREDLENVFKALGEAAERYAICFTSDVEADVRQEELDARLQEIWGDDLDTFYKRYPRMKQMDYSKPMKGWT